LLRQATRLAGYTLESIRGAALAFQAFTTRGAAGIGFAALLAIARAEIFNADITHGTIEAQGANAAYILLAGALIPAALFRCEVIRRYEALGHAATRGNAHTGLADPVSGALPAGTTAVVIAALFAKTVGDTGRGADTTEHARTMGGFRRTGAAGPGAMVIATLLTLADWKTWSLTDIAAVRIRRAGQARRTVTAGFPATVVSALFVVAVGLAVDSALAKILVADGFGRAVPALTAAAVVTTLLAGALRCAGIRDAGSVDTWNAFFACSAGTAASVTATDFAFAVRLTRLQDTLIVLVACGIFLAGAAGFQAAGIQSAFTVYTRGHTFLFAASLYTLVVVGADAAKPETAVFAALLAAAIGLADFTAAIALLCA
jgi:hypothetical protein